MNGPELPEDAALAAAREMLVHPVISTVIRFLHALETDDIEQALALSTPEKDRTPFAMKTDAHRYRRLNAKHQFGIFNRIEPGFGAPDIAYVRLFVGDGRAYAGQGEVGMIVTVVHRPEHGGWLVHAVGARVLPADVARSI